MKLILWCLLLLGRYAVAQDVTSTNGTNDVTGNPYLFKDWNNGTVRFTSGREMKQFKLKFDVFKNQLLLQFQGSTFAAESKVKEFVLQPKNKDSLLFSKGYPATANTNGETYFQVLFKDKVQLLKLFGKNIMEEKTLVNSGKNVKRLEDAESYFLFQNNQLIALPGKSSELAAAFPEKKTEMAAFMAETRMRSEEDFLAVVKKYNALLP